MPEINRRQIGGTHYHADYAHWDWIAEIGLGYFEGQITRYVMRYKKKDGAQALEKAMHFVEKLIEVFECGWVHPPKFGRLAVTSECTVRFALANDLDATQTHVCTLVSVWETKQDLLKIHIELRNMLEGYPK